MPGKKFKKTCKGCKKPFEGTNKQSYCSRSCGLSHTKVSRDVICVDCGIEFIHAGRGRKLRCAVCHKKHASKYQMRWRADRDANIKVGVGSGGNQWGEANSQYKPADQHKNTKYRGNYRSRCSSIFGRECQGEGPHKGDIQVHHIDGDPENLSVCNLIPLCFNCHWLAHRKKWKQKKEYIAATYEILPEGSREKIAELSGKAEMPTRTEDID